MTRQAAEAAEGAVAGRSQAMVERLVEATLDVFATMIARPLRSAPPQFNVGQQTAAVVATVGFAGSSRGLVAVCCSSAAAREITAAMLGLEPDAVADDVPDAMGEVANMVAGGFRTKMSSGEDRWEITMPVVTIGEHFTITYSSDTFRVVCPFTMGPHEIVVELVVQPEQH